MSVFDSLTGKGYTPTVGDAINVTGSYSPFDQIPELAGITAIARISTGNPVPGPIVATIPDLNFATLPLGSPAPPAVGEYVFTLDDVTISGQPGPTWGNGQLSSAANESMTITDSNGNSMQLFYWPSSFTADAQMYGGLIPTGPANITGFMSDFGSAPQFTPLSITPVPKPSLHVLCLLAASANLLRRRFSAQCVSPA